MRTLAPLAQDLAEWRLRAGRPPDAALMFPAHDGEPWSPDDWKNWRRRVFRPAAASAGAPDARPYDLRHSFVSLLIAEGSQHRRGRASGRPLAEGGARHLRARLRRVRPCRARQAVDRIRAARDEMRRRSRQPTLFDIA